MIVDVLTTAGSLAIALACAGIICLGLCLLEWHLR